MNCVDFGGHFIQPHKKLMKSNRNHRMFFLLSGTAVPWSPPLIGARDNIFIIIIITFNSVVNFSIQLATSRLACVSIATCADEIDFQVDLRLTWGRPEANVLNVLVNTTSWLEVDLRLTWGRPPGLHRRHKDRQIIKKRNIWHGDQNSVVPVKMAITRRRSKLWWRISYQSKTLDVSYLSSLSKTWFKALWDFFSKICMRPWIRSFWNIWPKRPLRTTFWL